MGEKIFIKKYRQILKNLFQDYQKKINNQKTGVFLSGGIDSSIIAYFISKYFKNPLFFTLNSKNALDLEYVKILNNYFKKQLIVVNFDDKKVNNIKEEVIKVLKNKKIPINPTQVSLACAFYLLCKEAYDKKVKFIFTGQGPDILLGGYNMYKNISLQNLNEKIKNDLPLLEIDKIRDQSIADIFKIKLINPYLEKEFIEFSLVIPPELKINKINDKFYEKYLSRKVGEYLKLPKEIILRHKKALQYSTKIRKYC